MHVGGDWVAAAVVLEIYEKDGPEDEKRRLAVTLRRIDAGGITSSMTGHDRPPTLAR